MTITKPAPMSAVVTTTRASRLPLFLKERRIFLTLGDVTLLNVALYGYLVWADLVWNPFSGGILAQSRWFISLTFFWLFFTYLFDGYNLAKISSPLHSVWLTSQSVIATTTFTYLIPYLGLPVPEYRSQAILFILGLLAMIMTWRMVFATLFVQPVFNHTALVIGAGTSGEELANVICEMGRIEINRQEARTTGYQIIGFIDDDPEKEGQVVSGYPVLGSSEELLAIMQRHQPSDLVVSITHTEHISRELFEGILLARQAGVNVTTMQYLYEQLTGRIPVEHVGRDLSVVIPLKRSGIDRIYLAFRRIFDILTALIGCLLTIFLIPFVWMVNRFTDPGDIFYRQTRIGRSGKPFEVIKFRSMVMNAEQVTGAVWASENDSRITPLGQFLRRTRIDEIPQFWNVLRGEMSLIGPRPERPHFVNTLVQEVPFYQIRHAVRPGITGWAQVKYRYGASVVDAKTKLEYDLYYIKHQGPFLDLQILIKTLQVVFGLKGR